MPTKKLNIPAAQAVASPPMIETPPPSRMTLANVVRGRQVRPVRVVMYGTEGVGKSTFASESPDPIFLGAEDGTAHLEVDRLPQPETWLEVLQGVRLLANEPHTYKTIVVDTLDWVEPLLWNYICKRDGKASIEDYGYGRGYHAALDEWRVLLNDLERLRYARDMHIILLGHTWIKGFRNPAGEDYDRFEMKVHNRVAGLVKEWADAVLFAVYEEFVKKDERTKRVRGISSGARLIYTVRTASHDAKNRYDLPETLPLNWDDFWSGVVAHRPAEPEALVDEIARKAEILGGEVEEKAMAHMLKHRTNPAVLAKLNDRLNAKMAEREDEE